MTGQHGLPVDGDDPDRGTVTVEYCANNVDGASRPLVDELACPARGLPCLERCGTCRRSAFLVVDGTVRTGASHADLVADILEGSP